MKTITELNSKWWYRLVKVIYLLTFVTALGSSLFIPPMVYLDPYEKEIECGNGLKINSNQLSDKGIYINLYTSDAERDNDIKIKRICVPDTMYISRVTMQKIFDERPKGTDMDKALEIFIKNGWTIEGVNTSPDKVYKEYTAEDFKNITYEVKGKINWVEMISVMLGSFFGVLVFFELTRRIFYYVVLGAIKPTK